MSAAVPVSRRRRGCNAAQPCARPRLQESGQEEMSEGSTVRDRRMSIDPASSSTGGDAESILAAVTILPVAALVVDADGVALSWNASASALLGWPEAGPGRRARLCAPETFWFRRLREEAASGRGRAAASLRFRVGAKVRRARVLAARLEDRRGHRPLYLLCFESRRAQTRLGKQLREAERRYDDLVEFSPDAIAIHDDNVLYLNPAACRLIGAERPDEVIGRSILDFVHPEERSRIRTQYAAPVRERRSARTRERRLLRLDGQVIDAEVVAVPITYRRSPAVQVMIRDMTAQRQAEAGLRMSQERFRLLAEGVRDYAILMLDPLGFVTSWNRGAERLTGLRADEAIRKPIDLLFTEEDNAAARGERVLADAVARGRCEDEGWCVRSDGSRFWASIAVTALLDPDGRSLGFAAIVRDLTERREAEAALRRSEDHLRQAQKMEGIGRLAGGIAHDFNNLLTAIQGHAQFLLEDLPVEHPTRGDAEEIRRAADRAAALTRQLLAFSRRQVLQPQVLDLNAVIRDMNKMLRRVIREDIALVTSLAEDAWNIYADAGQIEQVLMNLVVNARDAMPSGGSLTVATRNIEIEEGYVVGGAGPHAGFHVQLTVSDTGLGMDKETQARIFEPFFTTKPEGQGTGLGLATVYGIVQQSGGHISVYSEPGRGTTFRILLRRHIESGEHERAPIVREPARGWESVLVVEDDPAVRSLTRRVLQDRGYSVLEAGDGAEALRLAREYDGPIDLLVTDIVMPEMSGRKLAESVRSLHPAAKVLFMSGFTEQDVRQQGLLDPNAPFVEKPFSPERLARRVRETLGEQ
jgi:two-component system, cell cycle sensor histidine kinase and response regulator CckA